MKRRFLFVVLISAIWCTLGQAKDWKPVPGRLTTQFASGVSPHKVWSEYPRPQMHRAEWQSLNGLWDYAIAGTTAPWTNDYVQNALFDPLLERAPAPPVVWDGKILVPFCPESALSGVGKLVRPQQLLWYRRQFEVPSSWAGRRVLLHFEAVDWHAVVWVNGVQVGDHKGGYLPFACELSNALRAEGPQEIRVVVWDPTNLGDQAVGKQALPERKKGYRYTPTTGIWQSVWIEPVTETSVETLKLTPDLDGNRLILVTKLRGETDHCRIEAQVLDAKKEVARSSGAPGQPISILIPKPKLWSPNSPFLYNVKVSVTRDGQKLDEVSSYFGMRKIEVCADAQGIPRIWLNGSKIFQFGPLDQGYWPESLLTPPSDAAAKLDVQYLRDIGCNMVRVHIKVHPARWYHWCDKLGLLVWQDFPCTRKFDPHITKASAAQWEQEQGQLLDHLHNHPSIVMWVVFNEGWGQYDTQRLTAWTMGRDPSRLVNNASGWTDVGQGHLYDVHDYTFHPSIALPGQITNRAMILGECGGFNLVVPGHAWENYPVKTQIDPKSDLGREDYPSARAWLPRYSSWVEDLRQLQALGLNAAVYTQLSDIEHECNGWLTYDRKVSKISERQLRNVHNRFYQEPLPLKSILPLMAQEGRGSRFTVAPVRGDWIQGQFDDSDWQQAAGTLRLSQAQAAAGTNQGPIRLRRTFSLDHLPKQAAARIVATGRARIYLNGELVKELTTSDLAGFVPTSIASLAPEALKKFQVGQNLLAVELSASASTQANSAMHLDVGLFEPR